MLHLRSKIAKAILAIVLASGIFFSPGLSVDKPISDFSPARMSFGLATANAAAPQYEITQILVGKRPKVTWVKDIYNLTRGFLNILLLLVLIYIAFMNILNRDMNNYAIKAILPKIIIVAVAANLAIPIFAILSSVIDNIQGNIALFKPRGIDWEMIVYAGGGSIFKTLGFWAIFGIIGTIVSGGVAGIGCLIGGLLVFAAIVIVLILNLILAFRPYIVLICAAVAPLAIGCYILPQTKALFDRWIKIAVPWLFLPLPVFFLVNIGLKIPTDYGIAGDGAVSSILGEFLPALFRAGLLILAIRFPFTIEKDVATGIAKLGGMAVGAGRAGVQSVAGWDEQTPWIKGFTQAGGVRGTIASLGKGLGVLANRPVSTIAGWAGYLGGGTAAEREARIRRYQSNSTVRQIAKIVPPAVALTVIPQLIEEKKKRNESILQDTIDEDMEASGYWRDQVAVTGAHRKSFDERGEDMSAEEIQEELRKDLLNREHIANITKGLRNYGNPNGSTLANIMKREKSHEIFREEFEAEEGRQFATERAQFIARGDTAAEAERKARGIVKSNRAEIGRIAKGNAEPRIAREHAIIDGFTSRDQVHARLMSAANTDEFRKKVALGFMNNMVSTRSSSKVNLGGEQVGHGGMSKKDFDLAVALLRTLKRKSARQFEQVGAEDVYDPEREISRGEVLENRDIRKYAGGYNDNHEEDEETADEQDASADQAVGPENPAGPKNAGGSNPSDPMATIRNVLGIGGSNNPTGLGLPRASADINLVLSQLPLNLPVNLTVDTIRKMAKAYKLEGAFGSAGDSVAPAAIIASSLEKVMSPERFATFAGAMAQGDDVTVNNVLQGAKGQERDLLHASIASNEITKAHALESGEAQNVAVYATRIAPQYAVVVRNNPKIISDLKQSAETIITQEDNAAFNATRPAGAAPRASLPPEALEPHRKAIAQMVRTSPDTIDSKSAQFFLRAVDALDAATSKPAARAQTTTPVPKPGGQSTGSQPTGSPAPTPPAPDLPSVESAANQTTPTTPNKDEG